ncbi:MAG TPA: hypothetical protein VNE61_00635, partial [Ktedonobacteraceae bacterium]|nr:hypothetical protein [Ktedonobacteraceae bacterium]
SCNFYNLTDYSSNVDCDGSAISQGLNESNLIDITAYGDNITIYVNTKETMSIQDNSYTKGVIALIAEDNGDSTEVIYSNAKIWT